MSSTSVWLLLAVLFAVNINEVVSAPRRWCFYTNWSQYRKFPAGFRPRDIDASMCTHISYAFAGIKEGKTSPFEWNDDDSRWSRGMYSQVNDLKSRNPGLKTLLAVGGWNLGSLPFSHVVATNQTRQQFVFSTIRFLRARNFDGLDICWEYPTSRGSPPEDRENLALLLKDLRKAFNEEATASGRERLLLGIIISSDQNLIAQAYDIKAIKRSVNAVSVLSYDFYTATNNSQYVMHTSALHPGSFNDSFNGQRNVETAARFLVTLGIPKRRINIGICLHARTFRLRNSSSSEEGAVAVGPGNPGPYTKINGYLAYYEVCELKQKGGQIVFMADRGVPYMVYQDQWISFENTQSVTLKTDFAMSEGFGGVMVWSFDMDDFSGTCPGGKKYPLLRAIHMATKKRTNKKNMTPTTEAPSTTDTPMSDSEWIRQLCEKNQSGIFKHRTSCESFIVCVDGSGFISHCSQGQLWDTQSGRCIDDTVARCT